MKLKRPLLILLALLMFLSATQPALAALAVDDEIVADVPIYDAPCDGSDVPCNTPDDDDNKPYVPDDAKQDTYVPVPDDVTKSILEMSLIAPLNVTIPPHLQNRTVVVQLGNDRAVVDGEYIIMIEPSIAIGQRLLIPIYDIAELMGADAVWNATTEILSVAMGNQRIEMEIGSYYLRRWLDGERVLPDVHFSNIITNPLYVQPPQLVGTIPYAPFGVLAMSLGGYAVWYAPDTLGIASLRPLTPGEISDLVNIALPRLDPNYVPTEGISIARSNEHLIIVDGAAETVELEAVVYPANASDRTIRWTSSNPAVAAVDDYGEVTAISEGFTVISARGADNGVTATVDVTVAVYFTVTGISVNPDDVTFAVGATEQLTATIYPADATNQSVTWASDDTAIVTVNDNGQITAIAEGDAIITVTSEDGGHSASATVTVYVPVTGVSVSPYDVIFAVDTTEQLTETVYPADATNQAVTWASDDPAIVTVDDYGQITAIAEGVATITVTTKYGGFTAYATVTVYVPVVGVSVSPDEVLFAIGETEQLTATIYPANATNQSVTWETSDPAIVTVDDYGQITAIAEGEAIITVTTEYGGFTAHAAVTVYVPIAGISIVPEAITLTIENTVPETAQLEVVFDPERARPQIIDWESDDTAVVTVDDDGQITAVSVGTATITATTADGLHTATATVNVVARTSEIILKSDFAEAFIGRTVHVYDFDPLILHDGRSLVALRTIIDALADDYIWIPAENAVRIYIGAYIFNFRIGRETMMWMRRGADTHSVVPMRVETIALGERMYVPVRYMMDVLGWDSYWLPGIYGEEYVLLTAQSLDITGQWTRVREAQSADNWNILPLAGVAVNDTRTMVPLRSVIDAFADDYAWFPGIQTARIYIGEYIFNFQIGRGTMMWMRRGAATHSVVPLRARAHISGGGAHIPIRYIADVLGWDDYMSVLSAAGVAVNARREIAIIPGSTHQLTATILPDTLPRRNIQSLWHRWESSNPNIVWVDYLTGEIEARGVGVATVTVRNAAGQTEDIFVRVMLTAPDGLRALNVTHNSLHLRWESVPGAAFYRIEYRLPPGDWRYCGTVEAPQLFRNLTDLMPNTRYEFRVTAQADWNRNNPNNSPTSATIGLYTRLEPVSPWVNLRTHESARINWVGVPGGIYYRVEQLVGGTWQHAETTRAGFLDVSGLAPNTAHYFRIIAQRTSEPDAARDSLPAGVTVWTRLEIPANFRSTAAYTTRVQLAWSAVPGAWGYRIERNSGGGWVYAGSPRGTSHEVTDLSGGVWHRFRIRAQLTSVPGGERDSLWSGEISVLTRPHAPTNVRATGVSFTNATIHWNASPGIVTHYTVYRYYSTSINANYTHVATVPAGTTSAPVTLTAERMNTFRVRAHNASGRGSASGSRVDLAGGVVITWNTRGGSTVEPWIRIPEPGQTLGALPPAPRAGGRIGFEFVGWFREVTRDVGNPREILPTTLVPNLNPGEDVTFYAIWYRVRPGIGTFVNRAHYGNWHPRRTVRIMVPSEMSLPTAVRGWRSAIINGINIWNNLSGTTTVYVVADSTSNNTVSIVNIAEYWYGDITRSPQSPSGPRIESFAIRLNQWHMTHEYGGGSLSNVPMNVVISTMAHEIGHALGLADYNSHLAADQNRLMNFHRDRRVVYRPRIQERNYVRELYAIYP